MLDLKAYLSNGTLSLDGGYGKMGGSHAPLSIPSGDRSRNALPKHPGWHHKKEALGCYTFFL